MSANVTLGQTLHAAIIEIERGLFHASYRTDGPLPANRRPPPYQVGSSAADAMLRIERCAMALGFEAVIWEAPACPAFVTGNAASHGAMPAP